MKLENIFKYVKEYLQTPEEREQKQIGIINNMRGSVENILCSHFCNDTGETEYFSKASIYKLKDGLDKSNFLQQIEEKLLSLDKRINISKLGNKYSVILSENTEKGSYHNIIKTFILE